MHPMVAIHNNVSGPAPISIVIIVSIIALIVIAGIVYDRKSAKDWK